MKLYDAHTYNLTEQYEIDIEINSKELKDVQEHINYYKRFENYSYFELEEKENSLLLCVHFDM